MLRQWLIKLIAKAKAEGGIDLAARYNPLLRRYVRSQMQQAATSQQGLTKRLLRAARSTEYGKSRSAENPADWPVLKKEEVRLRPGNFVNPRVWLRLPAGTGGTSGVPLKLWRSLESVVAEQAFIDSLLEPYGFSMRSKLAVLRGDSVKLPADHQPPFGRISHSGNRLTLSSMHLGANTLDWFMNELERFQPKVLWVYPNAVTNLLALSRKTGRKLHIPVILASSEMLSPEVHRGLEEQFGATVVNYYGQAERACLAYSTKPGEFRFDPRYGRVELFPLPQAEGGMRSCRIVATGFWNLAMPLPRYETGDLMHVPEHFGAEELEEIALGKRAFTAIAGRESEYLLTREGMRIIGLNQIPREIEHVFQMQLVQRDYEDLLIQVIPMPGFNDEVADKIKRQASGKVPSSIRIEVKTAERLLTTPHGKTPLVIRLMDNAAA